MDYRGTMDYDELPLDYRSIHGHTKEDYDYVLSECESPKLVIDMLDIEMQEAEDYDSDHAWHRHHHHQQQRRMELASATATRHGRRRQRRKQVSFSESALVYGSTRTPEDVNDSWYTKAELTTFKNDRRETVRVLKKSNFDIERVGAVHCLRGYEAYMSIEINKATKYCRELVLNLVFSEQNRQRMVGIVDHESIRIASQHASSWALRNALEVGSNDAAFMMLVRLEYLNTNNQHNNQQRQQQQRRHHHADRIHIVEDVCRQQQTHQQQQIIIPQPQRSAPARASSFNKRSPPGRSLVQSGAPRALKQTT